MSAKVLHFTSAAFLALGLLAACSDSGPNRLSVAGTWTGSAQFGGTQGVSMTFTLSQSGDAISGTVRATGALPFAGVPVAGEVDTNGRTVTWLAVDGCETWGGVLTVDAAGTAMSGGILVDRSGCSSGSNSGGTLTLTRQ